MLDLRLVGSQVNDEDQRVVVLNLLHGALRGEWVLDDGVLVQSGPTRDALARVLGPPPALEGLGTVEVDRGADLRLELRVNALQHGFLGLEGVRFGLRGLARRSGLAGLAWRGRERSSHVLLVDGTAERGAHVPPLAFLVVFSFATMCSVGERITTTHARVISGRG